VKLLEAIATGAAERGLPFLVAGGHAVIAHGNPRNTFDLDLIIRRVDRAGWEDLASRLNYTFFREGPTFLQFNPPHKDILPLDMMMVSEETFAKLAADAVPAPVRVEGAKVVSLNHLLALKCHAIKHGHKGRIVKDADDVINLVQANRLDPDAPDIREMFRKHGTEELYQKVRKACRAA
jgi:hypothetical protein